MVAFVVQASVKRAEGDDPAPLVSLTFSEAEKS